jgi:hypothetical protein
LHRLDDVHKKWSRTGEKRADGASIRLLCSLCKYGEFVMNTSKLYTNYSLVNGERKTYHKPNFKALATSAINKENSQNMSRFAPKHVGSKDSAEPPKPKSTKNTKKAPIAVC